MECRVAACISNQWLKVSLFYAPKIIKIGGHITKLQSVKKWHIFLDTVYVKLTEDRLIPSVIKCCPKTLDKCQKILTKIVIILSYSPNYIFPEDKLQHHCTSA